MSENYLNVVGRERVRLEVSCEYTGAQLPQLRSDDPSLHRNLIVAYAANGYKCPVELCIHTLPPRIGMKTRPERDTAVHLQHLDVEPEMRENMILEHWEQHRCPISTVASV